MTTVDLARQTIQAFANEHKLIFEDRGECGFGRPCVGLLHGDTYVSYSPTTYVFKPGDLNISDITIPEGFERERQVYPPDSVIDAYHKDDCIAVLVHDDNYDRAILQLADWVTHLISVNVEVAEYPTGAQGIHAVLHGLFGYAIRRKEPAIA